MNVNVNDIDITKKQLAAIITEYYGEQCPDYEPTCICCEMWQHFYSIFEELDYMKGYIDAR